MTTLPKINELGQPLVSPCDEDPIMESLSDVFALYDDIVDAKPDIDEVQAFLIANNVVSIAKASDMKISKDFKLSDKEKESIAAKKRESRKKIADHNRRGYDQRKKQKKEAIQMARDRKYITEADFAAAAVACGRSIDLNNITKGKASGVFAMLEAGFGHCRDGMFTKKLEGLLGSSCVYTLDQMLSFLSMVRILMVCDDYWARMSAIRLWLRVVGVGVVESSILAVTVATLAKAKPQKQVDFEYLKTESKFSEELDKLGDILEYTFDSAFADSLKTLLIGVASMKMLPYEHAITVFSWCGAKMTAPLYEIVRVCVKALARVVRVVEDVFAGVPLNEAVFAKDPFMFHKAQANTLLFQKDFLYVGLPSPGKYNRSDWLKKAYETKNYFAKRAKVVSQMKTKQYGEITKLLTTIEAAISEVEEAMNAQYRNAPYGGILGEDPGIGKSQLVDLFVYVWCKVTGTTFSTDLIFHRNMASDYMDALDNQIAFHYSEVGSSTAKILSAMGDVFGNELCSIMDSQPMVANMAQVEKKGKKYIAPQLLVIDSNCPDLGVKYYKRNWGAFARRLPVHIFSVKPMYRKDGGVGIDPAKVEANPPVHAFDLYDSVKTYMYKVTGPTSAEKYLANSAKDIFEWCLYIAKHMRAHLAAQDYVKQLRDSGKMFDIAGLDAALENMSDGDSSSESSSSSDDDSKSDTDSGAGVPPPSAGGDQLQIPLEEEEVKSFDYYASHDESKDDEECDPRPASKLDKLKSVWQVLKKTRNLGLTHGDLKEIKRRRDVRRLEQLELLNKDDFDEMQQLARLDVEPEKPIVVAQSTCQMQTDEKQMMFELSTQAKMDEKSADPEVEELMKLTLDSAHLKVKIKGVYHIYISDKNVPGYFKNELIRRAEQKFSMPVYLRSFGYFDPDEKDYEFVDPDLKKVFTMPPGSSVSSVAVVPVKDFSLKVACSQTLSCVWEMLFYSIVLLPFLVVDWMSTAWTVMKAYFGEFVLKCIYLCILWYCGSFYANLLVPVMSATAVCHQAVTQAQTESIKWKLRVSGYVNRVMSFTGSAWSEYKWSIVATAVGVSLGGVIYAMKRRSKSLITGVTQSVNSKLMPQSATLDRMHGFEQAYGVGPQAVYRNMNGLAQDWGWQLKPSATAVCKSTKPSDLKTLIDENQRRITVKTPDGSISGHCLLIKGDWCAINHHYFVFEKEYETVELIVQTNKLTSRSPPVTKTFLIRKEDYKKLPGSDAVMLQIFGIYGKDLTPHLFDGDVISPSGNVLMKGVESIAEYVNACLKVWHEAGKTYIVSETAIAYPIATQAGDCGLAAVYQINGTDVAIFGIHATGGMRGGKKYGFATRLRKSDVLEAMRKSIYTQALSIPDVPVFVADTMKPFSELFEAPHKSMFRYYTFDHIDYFGYTGEKVMISQSSDLVTTIFAKSREFKDTMKRVFNVSGFARTAPPVMKPGFYTRDGVEVYIDPYANGVKKADKPSVSLDRRIMDIVCEEMTRDRIRALEKAGVTKLSPKSVLQAVNGTVDDDSARRINVSTAAGFGFPGKKEKYLPLISEEMYEEVKELGYEPEHCRFPTEEVCALMEEVANVLRQGFQVCFVYKVSLKDEPRAWEKVQSGSTRLFYVSPLVHLLLSKMFLSSYYNLMMVFPEAFNCAIGINMHRECDKVFAALAAKSELWMEGDYSGFDLTMPYEIRLISATVRHNVLKHFGYTEEALKIADAMMFENMNVFWCVNGEICRKQGSIPSGQDGTAQSNCDDNEVMYRYGHKKLCGLQRQFEDDVLLRTFGDDSLCAVVPEIADQFNNITFCEVVKNDFRMGYTSAAKDGTLHKFVQPLEAQFLKRTWKKHAEGKMVAPLMVDSLAKMMFWRLPSQAVGESEQLKQMCSSFLRESFFHLDEGLYTQMRTVTMAVYEEKFPLGTKVEIYFPTYEYLRDYYFGSGSPAKCHSEWDVISFDSFTEGESVLDVRKLNIGEADLLHEDLDRSLVEVKQEWSAIPANYIRVLKDELKNLQKQLLPGFLEDHTVADLEKLAIVTQNVEIRKEIVKHLSALRRIEEIELTLFTLNRRQRPYRLRTECGCFSWVDMLSEVFCDEIMEIIGEYDGWGVPSPHTDARYCWYDLVSEAGTGEMSQGAVESKEEEVIENVISVGGDAATKVMDPSYEIMTSSTSHDASKFLERGIIVFQDTIPEGSEQFYAFNPWRLFLQNPSIRAKLKNYAFLRGDLHARISVSASPFHYQILQVGYVPFSELNEVANTIITEPTTPAALMERKRTYLSQIRGSVLMKVGENKPCDFDIPFISPKPTIRLYNEVSTVIGSSSIFDDAELGTMFILPYTPLHANTSVYGTATLQVHLSMKNPVLGGLTGTVMALTTEAEFVRGPVETIASSVAKVTTALSHIYPWAKPSAMIASGIERIAALLGWSVPNVLPSVHMPMLVRQDAYQNEVLCISAETGRKMAFDPLQELTVDPRIAGVEEDELSISYLAGIPSYLTQFRWTDSVAPLESLWRTWICPLAMTNPFSPPATDGSTYPLTACAFAMAPFRYWRGEMEYTFVVSKSNMHRGILGVRVDPNIPQAALIMSEGVTLNKQGILLFDLQTSDTFRVCVKWMHDRQWASVPTYEQSSRMVGDDTLVIGDVADCCNGWLQVFPYTQLTGPEPETSSNIQVEVLVFVRLLNARANVHTPQDLPYAIDLRTEAGVMFRNEMSCFEINEEVVTEEKMSENLFGEEVHSFRGLLKRFSATWYLSGTNSAVTTVKVVLQTIPPLLPAVNTPIESSQGRLDLLLYLRRAFMGMRGSFRKRLFIPNQDFTPCDAVDVSLQFSDSYTFPSISFDAVPTPPNQSTIGVANFMPHVNSGLEFTIPYYSSNFFLPAGNFSDAATWEPANTNFSPKGNSNYTAQWLWNNPGTSDTTMREYTACGEDFQLLRFIAAPPITVSFA